MKKLFMLLFIGAFLFSAKLFAQTAATVNWDLGTNTSAAVTGNVEADTCFWSVPLALKDFNGGTLSGPAIRLYDSTGWGGGVETGPVLSRYIQFLVKPASGYNFHVDSVAFWLACYGTHGGLHAAVYWDTDTANFSQTNLLDYDSASYGSIKGLPDVRDGASGAPHDTSFAINTDVPNGGVFAFRVDPWYNAGSASTSKYIVMWLVRVYGTTSPATAIENSNALPNQYSLNQNYPNPFNPSTNISFDLGKAGYAKLVVYNTLGQQVATLISGQLSAGHHEVNFHATGLSSGVYFYRLESGNFTQIKKMILLQ